MTLTATPNVSAPCVTTNPCTCPTYGPGGTYLPSPDGTYCALALESPSGPPPQPVPTLSEAGFFVLAAALVVVGVRRLG